MILATHSLFETFPFQEFLVLRELVSTKCRSSNERFLNFISSKTWRWISTQNAYKQGNGLWLRGKCLYRCVLEWGLWQQREGLKQLHLSHSLHQSGIQAQLSWVLRRRQWHPHSSTLAWKIPWTEEPGRLQSRGSQRVGHDWVTSLSLFTFHFHTLEKEMATHSSVLAWRIPGTGKPCGLLSVGSHRVGHDWGDLAAAVL